MRTRMLPVAELSGRDVGAWDDLADRAVEPNPFFHPDFVLPAHRHLAESRVQLLMAEDRNGWLACLPVRARRWRSVPVPAMGAWCHTHCFLATPLVCDDRPAAALGALVDHVTRSDGVALFVLESLGQDGAVGRALSQALVARGRAAQVHRSHQRAALRRRAGGDHLARMGAHHRRELRRQRRRLEQELGGSLHTTDRAGDPTAVEEFLSLEAAGWKGRHGTALACVPGHAELFRELCRAFSQRGRLQLLALENQGRTVAMKCNLMAGKAVFCFKIAFDERLARFSPGVQLEIANVGVFEHGAAAWMDSCAAPDNQMINRLWPDRRRIETLLVPAQGALGRISAHGARAVRALPKRERKSPSPSC